MAVAKTVWLKSTASGNALTIAPDAGDFLIGWSTADGTYTITTPSGWTPIGSLLNTNAVEVGSTAFFYRRADGTETSVTFLWTSNNASVDGVAAFDNVNTDNPFDVTPVTDAHDTSDTVADTSITPTTDGCKIAYIVVGDGSSGTYTFTFSTQSGTTGAWSSPNEALVAGGYYNFAMNCCVQQTAGPITARCVVSTQCSRPALLVALRKAFDTYHGDLSETDSVSESVETTLRGGSVSLEDQVSVAEHGGVTSPFAQRDFVQNDFGQVFPAASSGQTYTEGVNESASVAEQGIVRDTAVQGVSDSHTAGEFAGAVATANQALNDSVGVVENLLAQGKSIQEIVEATGITEAQTIGVLLSAALADSVSKSDGIGAVKAAIQALSEATGTSEGISAGGSTIHTIGLEDSGAVSDALAAAYAVVQTVADSHGLSESQATRLTDTIGLADTVAKSEGFSGTVQAALALAEAVANVEELLASKRTAQDLADSLNITEAQAAGILLVAALAEAAASGDGIGAVVAALQALSDTGNVSDGISAGGSTTHAVALGEATVAAEVIANAATLAPVVQEVIGLTEAQAQKLTAILTIADSIAKGEGSACNMQAVLSLAEAVASVGDVLSGRTTTQALADSLSITEAQTAGIVLAAVLVEAVAHGDGIGAVVTALSDTGNVSDGISVGGSTTYSENLAETTGLSEGALAALRSAAGLADSGSVAEAVASARTCIAAVAEQNALTEQQTSHLAAALTVAEQVVGVDGVAAAAKLAQAVVDYCVTAETLLTAVRRNVDEYEGYALADSAATLAALQEQLDDVVSSAGVAAAARAQSLELSDALALGDLADTARRLYVSIQDDVKAEDSETATGGVEYATGTLLDFLVSDTDSDLLLDANTVDGDLVFLSDSTDGEVLFFVNRA